ncbi:hypothetical protein BB560_002644 [Smittium megazygosporum]|uniref:Uncharacterized protein n=1 Tax=Smittium megazygosporum TaxID=133381 RepID=A0A2T9ZEB1_9FUNG|nr:hypothetical protein BB560_002644 [Smittium megazygosporum]
MGGISFSAPTQRVFKNMPKVLSENTALTLLGKIEFKEDKDSELFFYSIKNEWNEVVLKILNTFTVKGPNQELFDNPNISEHEGSDTEIAKHNASTVAPGVYINKLNGKSIELGLEQNNIGVIKLSIKAHKITPSYKMTIPEPYKITTHKHVDLSNVPRYLVVLFVDKGQTEIVKLFLSEGENFRHPDIVLIRAIRTVLDYGVDFESDDLNIYDLEYTDDINSDDVVEEPLYDSLSWASGNGHLELVKLLLEYGADIDFQNKENPLAEASKNGHLDIVKFLLDYGADSGGFGENPLKSGARVSCYDGSPLKSASRIGESNIERLLLEYGDDVHYENDLSLMLASQNGHLDVVKLLLENGADVHGDIDYSLPLASMRGHAKFVKLLLDYGVDVHANNQDALRCTSKTVKLILEHKSDIHADNDFALRTASKNGHLELVKPLLEHGADVYADNDLALRTCFKDGNLEIVKLLLDGGADIHANDDDSLKLALEQGANIHAQDNEALKRAACCLKVEVVKYLDDRGSDVSSDRNTSFLLACLLGYLEHAKIILETTKGIHSESGMLLCWASEFGKLDLAKMLLDQGIGELIFTLKKAVLSEQQVAVLNGHLEVVKLFLEHGAGIINGQIWPLNDAMRDASKSGHLGVVNLLLDHGADIGSKEIFCTADALGLASTNGDVSVVQQLLDRGADIYYDNDYCLRQASYCGRFEVVKLLLGHGADINAENGEALIFAEEMGHQDVVDYL